MEQAISHIRSVPTLDSPQRKFSLNGDLWRQDDRSERSVRDKIAMFSSQSNLDAPLFPNAMTAVVIATSNGKRISKYKSSEDVCCDDKGNGPRDRPSFFADRTQSSFDLTDSAKVTPTSTLECARKYGQRAPSLPQTAQPPIPCPSLQTARVPKTLPVSVPPKTTPSLFGPSIPPYDKQILTNAIAKSCCANENSNVTQNVAYSSRDANPCNSPLVNTTGNLAKATSASSLTRATSFSGSSTSFAQEPGATTIIDLIGSSQVSRTNSLASTFRRPGEDARRSSLNQLIEQRRRSISKLRGLVIPEKDPAPIDQPIVDLPEIKSRDSILLHQVRVESVEAPTSVILRHFSTIQILRRINS